MNLIFHKNIQYYKFCLYGFFKNLRFFEPFLILFFLEKNISFFQIGVLYSLREIFVNIFEIPSGIIADSFGRKKSLILSFVFYIISFIVFYFSNSFILFLPAIICYAMGDAFRTGTHKAMIFDYLRMNNWDNQRVNYYGNTRSWSQFGSSVSSIIAALIVFYSGSYQSIFIFSTFPYFIDLIIISTYPKELDGINKKQENESIKKRLRQIIDNYFLSLKNKQILKAITNLSLHSGFHRSVKDYLQAVIQTFAIGIPILYSFTSKQKSSVLIGLIYFLIYILTSVASRNAGKLKNKLNSIEKALNLTMMIGFFFAFISGIVFHYGFYLVSIIFFVLIFLIENIRNPIGVAYVSELFDDKILATALSTNSQAKSLFAAIIAPLLGLLIDKIGIGFSLSSLAIVIVILTPLFWAKSKNKSKS